MNTVPSDIGWRQNVRRATTSGGKSARIYSHFLGGALGLDLQFLVERPAAYANIWRIALPLEMRRNRQQLAVTRGANLCRMGQYIIFFDVF